MNEITHDGCLMEYAIIKYNPLMTTNSVIPLRNAETWRG